MPMPAIYEASREITQVYDVIRNRDYIYSDPYFDTRERDIVGEGIGPNGGGLAEALELVALNRHAHLHDLRPLYADWRSRWVLPYTVEAPPRRAAQLALESAARLIEALIAFNTAFGLAGFHNAGDYSAVFRLAAEARELSDQAEAMYNQAWGSREERADREGWYGPPEVEMPLPGVSAVGRRIRLAREAAHLNQTELATRIGDRPSNISAMEAGRRSIGSDVLSKLSTTLSVSLDWLVYGKLP